MNKQEYIKKLDSLKLDKSSYRIISGGVMLLYDLKDSTADIDIKVRSDYFEKLQKIFSFKKSSKYPNLYEISDNIEVKVQNFDDNDTKIIDGYPVESLELTLQWMLEQNRPKDQEKIKIIQQYLEDNWRIDKTSYRYYNMHM